MESHLGFYSAFPDIRNYFPISGIGIPDIGKSISDIRKGSISRYREMIFGYREMIFRYREMCLISRYREINSRYPKIATRQKQVTSPPCNTALPHRPLSTMAPSYTGPSACGVRHYDFSKSISATNNDHTTDEFAKKYRKLWCWINVLNDINKNWTLR